MVGKKILINSVRLGVLNIFAGIFLMVVIFLMQGVFVFWVGILYIIFGYILIKEKFRLRLLFLGVLPIAVLYSLNIIMMVLSNNIPEYYKLPPLVALILLFPSFICILDIYYLTRPNIRMRNYRI